MLQPIENFACIVNAAIVDDDNLVVLGNSAERLHRRRQQPWQGRSVIEGREEHADTGGKAQGVIVPT
ncbi:MAG: hypothetical protein ABI972_30985 [Acidobacteriota bacterium]